jgi:hypothetical protein
MSKKQPTPKAETTAALKRRAETIINDSRGYDADTRVHVATMLLILQTDGAGEQQTAQLREAIRKAEAGEYVFDVDSIGAEYVHAAQLTSDLLNADTPPFIFDAVTAALREAERRFNVKLWVASDADDEGGSGGYSVRGMANLYAHHQLTRISFEPAKDLPALISAVMRHPDLPPALSEGFGEALTDLFNDLPGGRQARIDYHQNYIALLLEAEAEKGGGDDA